MLLSKFNLIAVAQIIGRFGSKSSRTFYDRIAFADEFLHGQQTRTVVARHDLIVPSFQSDNQIVVFRIPVVKRRNMKSAVKSVELIVVILKLLMRGIGEGNDALMAAAGDTYKAFVFDIYEDRLFAKNSRNDRAIVAKRTHSGLNLVSAFFKHYKLALMTRIFDILSALRVKSFVYDDPDIGLIL